MKIVSQKCRNRSLADQPPVNQYIENAIIMPIMTIQARVKPGDILKLLRECQFYIYFLKATCNTESINFMAET